MTNESLPSVLRSLRKERKLSLTRASQLSGIPRSNIYRYECGTSRIPVDSINSFAAAYRVPVEQILIEGRVLENRE